MEGGGGGEGEASRRVSSVDVCWAEPQAERSHGGERAVGAKGLPLHPKDATGTWTNLPRNLQKLELLT